MNQIFFALSSGKQVGWEGRVCSDPWQLYEKIIVPNCTVHSVAFQCKAHPSLRHNTQTTPAPQTERHTSTHTHTHTHTHLGAGVPKPGRLRVHSQALRRPKNPITSITSITSIQSRVQCSGENDVERPGMGLHPSCLVSVTAGETPSMTTTTIMLDQC